MSPTLNAILRSWPQSPVLWCGLILTLAVYLRGWFALHRRDFHRWHARQPVAFVGGLATIFVALGSPIEPFASMLLQVHMIQHVLLMMLVPPLVW